MFNQWINKNIDEWSSKTTKQAIQRANNYLIPKLGNLPIEDIKSSDIRNLLLKIQDTGKLDMLKKVRSILNGIFKYSVGMDIIKINTATKITAKGARLTPKTRNAFRGSSTKPIKL